MPASSKWFRGLHGGTPVLTAAEKVLGQRLRAVLKQAGLAVKRAHENAEHVHQLRVATRRARAALRLFGELLPPKLERRLRRELRRFRRAAGAARDWDVFSQALEPHLGLAAPPAQPGLNWLAGVAAASRSAAQAELVAVHTRRLARLQRTIRGVLRHLPQARADNNRGNAPPLEQLAQQHLPELLGRVLDAPEVHLDDAESLHRLRIDAKHLRYAMEILASCYPPVFRNEGYALVEAIQEALGKANDASVARGKLDALEAEARRFHALQWPIWTPGVEHMRAHYAAAREQALAEYAKLLGDPATQERLSQLRRFVVHETLPLSRPAASRPRRGKRPSDAASGPIAT
jgi:CHAD domain-containing protein